MRICKTGLWLLVMLGCSFTSVLVQASELAQPTGGVLLEVVGAIEHSNGTRLIDGSERRVARFDREMLESLPATSFTTKTAWTKGPTKFTGVRMSTLLEHIGAESSDLTLSALDDYTIRVTNPEYDQYPIVLAYKINDKYVSVRELGPLWVMYPFDDYPSLDTSTNRARCVWQLIQINVHE